MICELGMASLYKELEETRDQQYLRKIAFFAVVVSTVAVIGCVVTIPLLYTYVQQLHSHMLAEVGSCKVGRRFAFAVAAALLLCR